MLESPLQRKAQGKTGAGHRLTPRCSHRRCSRRVEGQPVRSRQACRCLQRLLAWRCPRPRPPHSSSSRPSSLPPPRELRERHHRRRRTACRRRLAGACWHSLRVAVAMGHASHGGIAFNAAPSTLLRGRAQCSQVGPAIMHEAEASLAPPLSREKFSGWSGPHVQVARTPPSWGTHEGSGPWE
jgi:hypothetical protein